MNRRTGFTLVELLVALFITAIMFAIGYRGLEQALSSKRELDEQSARLIAVQQAMRTMEQDFELLQPRPVRQPIGDGYLPALMSVQAAGLATPLGSSSGGFGSSAVGSSTSLGGGSSMTLGSSSGTSLGSGSSTSLGSSTGLGSSTSLGSTMTLSSSTNGTSSSSSSSSGGSSGIGPSGSAEPIVTLTRGSWTNPVGLPRSELQRVSYSIENGALVRSYWPVLDATTPFAPIKRTLVDHVKSLTLRYLDAGRTWQSGWPPGALGTGPINQTLRLRPVAVEVTLELDDWGVLLRYIEVPG
jgi:type II secretion system protein J